MRNNRNWARVLTEPEIATEIAFNAQAQELSQREIDVLGLITLGNSNKRIAWTLSIAEDTVKTHVKNIFTKLNVQTEPMLSRWQYGEASSAFDSPVVSSRIVFDCS